MEEGSRKLRLGPPRGELPRCVWRSLKHTGAEPSAEVTGQEQQANSKIEVPPPLFLFPLLPVETPIDKT